MSGSFHQKDTVSQEAGIKTLIQFVWPHLMRHKTRIGLVILSVVCLATVGRLLPNIIGKVIDQGVLKKDTTIIFHLGWIYLGLQIFYGFLLFFQNYVFRKTGNRILFEIRDQLIDHVQHLPSSYFERNPVGRTVTRLTNDVIGFGEFFTEGLVSIFTSVVTMMIIIIAMCAISPKLTLIVAVTTPPLLLLSYFLSQKIKILLREVKSQLARINAFVAESLNGMKVLQLNNKVPDRRKHFDEMSDEYRKIQLRTISYYARLWPMTDTFNSLTIAFAMLFGAYVFERGEVQLGALIAFFIHIQDFLPPLRNILEKFQFLQNSMACSERLMTLQSEVEQTRSGVTQLNFKQKSASIEFRNVSFRYSSQAPFALKNVSFALAPGERVALVGETGSGKSTIVSLIQRFYDPEEGDILLDGVNISKVAPQDLRKKIGVILQDNFVFRTSLYNNAVLFDSSIPTEKATRALQMARCQNVISKLGGIDGLLDERGGNISHGERQLVAFSRIFAFEPPLLVLDEATANIDSQTERLVQIATREATQNRTSLIIAHRLSTISECDRVLVLDKGHLVESGKHRDLMAQNGHYARFCASYFKKSDGTSPSAIPV